MSCLVWKYLNVCSVSFEHKAGVYERALLLLLPTALLGWESVRACKHTCACEHEMASNLFSMVLLPGIMQNISVGHISLEENILTPVIQVKLVLAK